MDIPFETMDTRQNPQGYRELTFLEITDNNKIVLYDKQYFNFLEDAGFRTVRDGSRIKLVRIQNNLIKEIIPHDIKRYLTECSIITGDEILTNYLLSNKKIYNQEYLYSLQLIEPDVVRDSKEEAYFFFQNGVVTVTANGISDPVPYERFGKLVWESKILPRSFYRLGEDAQNSVFNSFMWELAGHDTVRMNYIWSIIGYSLHNFRTSANSRAIILNDENLSDHPEGGSGKTLLVKALGKMRVLVEKDGKSFNPNSTFQWSDIDENTDLVLIDETSDNFAFEDLFSLISSGITIEKKFKDKYRLPIEQSPLFIITTNKIVLGSSGSFLRRQYSVDIHQYFSYKRTPVDEYGHLFFEEWDNAEWARFDNYMLICVRFYMTYGVMSYDGMESIRKRAARATSENFLNWYEDALPDLQCLNGTTEIYQQYLKESGEKHSKVSIKKFVNNVKTCSEIMGYSFIEQRSSKKRGFFISLN